MKKEGVLFPLASLPGRHGIGDFGDISKVFLKYLHKRGYKYWQVLPLNPVGPGNSPYMSTCSFALETRYISLDELYKDGLLTKKVKPHHENTKSIDYQDVLLFKEKYLKLAYKNFKKHRYLDFERFKKENEWVSKFGLFSYYRKANNFILWNKWSKQQIELTSVPAEAKEEVEFEAFKQYIAFKQWNKIRKYANKLGIEIIADCPFYVGFDSLDCLLNKDEFLMDENYNPTFVSGCPPDAFSEDGQLWGTPIYDFEKMEKNRYSFLINRIAGYMKTCDILRLDHFRGFDTYYVIPSNELTARNGEWKIGPRTSFFDELYRVNPNIKIIAEDLGELFPSVIELKDHYHLPGMFVVEFLIFDEKLIPDSNTIVYPGTHDNETLYGWIKSLRKEQISYLTKRFGPKKDLFENIMKYISSLDSLMSIYPLQDLLKLDNKARINTPGTVSQKNWSYKIDGHYFVK